MFRDIDVFEISKAEFQQALGIQIILGLGAFQHNGDQPPPVPLRQGHQSVSGDGGVAGFSGHGSLAVILAGGVLGHDQPVLHVKAGSVWIVGGGSNGMALGRVDLQQCFVVKRLPGDQRHVVGTHVLIVVV